MVQVPCLARCRQKTRDYQRYSIAIVTTSDLEGAAVWRRIVDAVAQLENRTPSGPVH
jgi:hypothetical protein